MTGGAGAGLSLLVGPDEFWNALAPDLQRATKSAYVQTMSFEADAAGRRRGEERLGEPAAGRVGLERHRLHVGALRRALEVGRERVPEQIGRAHV